MKHKFILLFLFAPLGAGAAHAQGTARSMDLDVSIRSAALGGASNALFWGQGVNHWGNPAMLANLQGVLYERGKTQLVPGLASDVRFESQVTKFGVSGAGVVFSGNPFPDGVELDYGRTESTDEAGNPTGTFHSFETVDSWGFGVSPIWLVERAMQLGRTQPPRLLSQFHLAFGMNFKDVFMQIAPGFTGETKARDWGVLVGATPINLSPGSASIPLRVDVAYGRSVLSFNDDATIRFRNEGQAYPVSRHRRHGVALRVAFDHTGLLDAMKASTWGWFLEGLTPLVSVGMTADWANISAGGRDRGFDVSGGGLEIEIANIVALRGGRYRDRLGDIDGNTWGHAVTLPIGRVAGARYEESWFPQARDSGLPHVERKGYSAWFDPLAAWQALRRAPEGGYAHQKR